MSRTASGGQGDRWFWPAWGVAFVGFPIAGTVVAATVGPIETVGAAAVGGAIAGGVIGTAEWLVLRRRLPVSVLWVPVTAGGLAVGLAIGYAVLGDSTSPLPLILRGLLVGAAIGAGQAVVLRGILAAPILWAAAVTVAWPLGWAVTAAWGIDLAPKWAVFGSSGALTFQLATGLILAYLIQRRTGPVVASSSSG